MVYNAVVALGVVARALPWTQYQQLLGQFLRLMKRHADSNKARALAGSLHAQWRGVHLGSEAFVVSVAIGFALKAEVNFTQRSEVYRDSSKAHDNP